MDEVGLGALSGPICAVCVAVDADVRFADLKSWWPVAGVRDSKKTSPAQREALVPRIHDYLLRNGGSFGLGEVSVRDINDHGYVAALDRVKVLAVRAVVDDLRPDLLIVDGSVGLVAHAIDHVAQRVVPKADADYWVVAAASILAKHYRDRLMVELSRDYPEYQWQKNMGYTGGDKKTSPHVVALRRYGLTPHHRTLACRTVLS